MAYTRIPLYFWICIFKSDWCSVDSAELDPACPSDHLRLLEWEGFVHWMWLQLCLKLGSFFFLFISKALFAGNLVVPHSCLAWMSPGDTATSPVRGSLLMKGTLPRFPASGGVGNLRTWLIFPSLCSSYDLGPKPTSLIFTSSYFCLSAMPYQPPCLIDTLVDPALGITRPKWNSVFYFQIHAHSPE